MKHIFASLHSSETKPMAVCLVQLLTQHVHGTLYTVYMHSQYKWSIKFTRTVWSSCQNIGSSSSQTWKDLPVEVQNCDMESLDATAQGLRLSLLGCWRDTIIGGTQTDIWWPEDAVTMVSIIAKQVDALGAAWLLTLVIRMVVEEQDDGKRASIEKLAFFSCCLPLHLSIFLSLSFPLTHSPKQWLVHITLYLHLTTPPFIVHAPIWQRGRIRNLEEDIQKVIRGFSL